MNLTNTFPPRKKFFSVQSSFILSLLNLDLIYEILQLSNRTGSSTGKSYVE
jgi:hypothetical protein